MLPTELLTGHPVIDEQHDVLVEALENTAIALQSKDKEKMKDKVVFLLNYTQEHFSAEEGLLAMARYPEVEQHKEQHEHMVAMVTNLLKDFEDDLLPFFTLHYQLTVVIIPYFLEHIKVKDKAFVDFLKSK